MASTTSASQLVPGNSTHTDGHQAASTVMAACSMTGFVRNRSHSSPTRALAAACVGRVDREADGLAHRDAGDLAEAERGQRALDGGALRVGDAGAQADLDEHGERHGAIVACPPGHAAKARPESRS